jgi:hypothetical protein
LKMRQTDSPLRLVIYLGKPEKREYPHPPANLESCDVSHSRACQENVMVYAHGLKVFWEFTNHSNLYDELYLGRTWWLIMKLDIWILEESIMLLYSSWSFQSSQLERLVDHNHFS